MAEILITPGKQLDSNTESVPSPNYLLADNCLSEFNTEAKKATARLHLGVPAVEDTYTQEKVKEVITDNIAVKLDEHINDFDHITQEEIIKMLDGFIRQDGSVPFTQPQSGKTPTKSSHLTTKLYVDQLVSECLKVVDRDRILEQVENSLRDYVKQESFDVTKKQLETDISKQQGIYVKLDGTTPFEAPQIGRDPKASCHLATKGYVDGLLQESIKKILEPYITEKLTSKLKRYALKTSVYDTTQTYSKGEIEEVIDKLVDQSVDLALDGHIHAYDPHNILSKVRDLGYVTNKGRVAFLAPQKGVDAEKKDEFVTLGQVDKKIEELTKLVQNYQPTWITSGPVETTVGFIEDNTILPQKMPFQELMDAIFYGKRIRLTVPDVVDIGAVFPITLCIQGPLDTVNKVEIYQQGELLDILYREQLAETGCATIESLPADSDQEILAKVIYTNGTMHEITRVVKTSLPIFIGILPRWEGSNTITFEELEQLVDLDPNSKFYYEGNEVQVITHQFNFDEDVEQKIVVALPVKYPNLSEMSNSAQVVTQAAFDKIESIPFRIYDNDEVYKIYVYKQDLFSLNTTMNFKFE